MKTQYLIVPAWSDQAGQCRIVARSHEQQHPNPLQHYRQYDSQWKEVGVMNSQGKLVYLDAPAAVVQDFKDSEPLAAGLTFAFDAVEQTREAPPAPRAGAVVLFHPEDGIYLGHCMGLGFWTKLDPVGQPSAVCFDDEADARAHMQTWECGPKEGVLFVTVQPDSANGEVRYASIQACVAAGLEAWDPDMGCPDQEPMSVERPH